jgi:phospholipid transport system substrate-binding protein
MRIFFSASLLALFLVAVWTPSGSRADAFTDGAKNFIENLAGNSLKTLTGKDMATAERHRRFKVLLDQNFSIKTIGRWVMGRYWRKATPAQKEEYFVLFESLVVKTYVDRFAKLSGATLEVKKAVSKGSKDTVVYSEFHDGNKKRYRINWRLRAKEGQFKIIDVMVAGISMGMTQRDEFASVIRKSGQGLEGLLNVLRKKKSL